MSVPLLVVLVACALFGAVVVARDLREARRSGTEVAHARVQRLLARVRLVCAVLVVAGVFLLNGPKVFDIPEVLGRLAQPLLWIGGGGLAASFFLAGFLDAR